jgi:hypothetical protein
MGQSYSLIDNGGPSIKCPLCLGMGEIDSLDEKISKIQEEKKSFTKKEKEKIKNGKKASEARAD